MKQNADLPANYWRAKRLQHIADRALKTSQRHSSISRSADHHFRRYLRLLMLSIDAWQRVPVDVSHNHPLREVMA